MPALRNNSNTPSRIMVAVRDATDLESLLYFTCRVAQAYKAEIYLITVNQSGKPPAWLYIPDRCQPLTINIVARVGREVGSVLLEEVQRLEPELLILGWKGQINQGRYFLGRTLDPVVQSAPCDVAVVRGDFPENLSRILVPVSGGPNAPRSLEIAQAIAPEAEITTLYVAQEHLGKPEELLGQQRLDTLIHKQSGAERILPRVVSAPTPVAGIVSEAHQDYDLLIVGAGNENVVGRFLFGDIPQAILLESTIPTMIVRRRLTNLGSLHRRVWMYIFDMVPTLTVQEQTEVYRMLRRSARPTVDFFVTLTLAAALASLGLLLDSPAVIIGAMMVAPMMTAILGMGFSIALGDLPFFWRAFSTTIRGSLLAVVMGFVVGLIVPGADITHEVLAFSQPTLLDLAVALASGAAAAYAISRKEVSAAFAGVAVAAALTPPLANIGLGLASQEWPIAWGAGLLFLANFVAIIAAGGLVFLWLGFRPKPGNLSSAAIRRRGLTSVGLLLLLVTIPLAILTSTSIQELDLQTKIGEALQVEVHRIPQAELVSWEIQGQEKEGTLQLDVIIRVPHPLNHETASTLQENVAARLELPVELSLGMVPATRLRAYIPPTPTPTGIPTATPTPTPTPTNTPTATPTATATPTSTPTPTPPPTITPTPTPWILTTTNLGQGTLQVRYAPDGIVIGSLGTDTLVIVLDDPVNYKGNIWYRIYAPEDHLEGWVAGAYLAEPTPALDEVLP